jgi:hypothetical protein
MMMVMVLFMMAFRKCRGCQCAKQDTGQHECEGLLLHYFLLLCDVASWASKMTSFVITPLALDFYSENQIITP